MDGQHKSSSSDFSSEVEMKNQWPTNISGTQLEGMNNDCLLEMFSKNSLSLLDLCSIAETCSRFRRITERIFPKKLALDKNEIFIVDSEKYYGQQLEQRDVERVMKNFGLIVLHFSISERISRCRRERGSLDVVFMDAVERNFFDNLKSLQIYGFKMPAVCSDKFKEIFKRLRLLELQWVSTTDATLFEGLDSLVELRVMQVERCDVILENFFPKLERFTYFTTDIRIADTISQPNLSQSFDTLLTFISRHNCLKSLDLCFYSHPNCVLVLLEAVGNSCKTLMELWIRVSFSTLTSAHLQPLKGFKSLKTLGLSEVPCGSFQFISGQTELRELHLHGSRLPGDLNHFDALARLTKLAIHNCSASDGFGVVHMIGRLTNLQELTIAWLYIQSVRFKLTRKVFEQVVSIVMDRQQVLTLKCEFNFDLYSPEMSSKIVLLHYVGE